MEKSSLIFALLVPNLVSLSVVALSQTLYLFSFLTCVLFYPSLLSVLLLLLSAFSSSRCCATLTHLNTLYLQFSLSKVQKRRKTLSRILSQLDKLYSQPIICLRRRVVNLLIQSTCFVTIIYCLTTENSATVITTTTTSTTTTDNKLSKIKNSLV